LDIHLEDLTLRYHLMNKTGLPMFQAIAPSHISIDKPNRSIKKPSSGMQVATATTENPTSWDGTDEAVRTLWKAA